MIKETNTEKISALLDETCELMDKIDPGVFLRLYPLFDVTPRLIHSTSGHFGLVYFDVFSALDNAKIYND